MNNKKTKQAKEERSLACFHQGDLMAHDSPRLLGLPHDEWRPSQEDAYLKARAIHRNGGGIIVIEAPTGVGKSGIATALGAEGDGVLVLAHNHGLLKQYERLYGFDIIMGKPEYDCVLPSKVEHWKNAYNMVPKASDCHYHNMYDCQFSANCPYVIARQNAMESQRAACTYKYAALSEWTSKRGGILVMDEAHDCYEELLEFSKFTMDEQTQKNFKFPKFPLYDFGQGGKGDLLEGSNRGKVMDWIFECMKKISKVDLFSEMTQQTAKNRQMFERLSSGLKMLSSGDPLFYRCSQLTVDDWRVFDTRSNPGAILVIRSLDVKDLVKKIIGMKDTVVMMSATIGNPKPLMAELGLPNFQFVRYGHPTPLEKRPIFDLGVDKMTKQNLDASPALYKRQSDRIASFIQSLDKDWRGIVVTSSNYKVGVLRNFLRQQLNGRVIFPKPGTGLRQQVSDFVGKKGRGEIMVGPIQGWGSGISLDYDIARISVVAGVAFANPGDRFDQLRMSTSNGKQYAFWNAYCGVVQATGRVSRGEIDENGEYELNVAALADGSTTTPQAKANYSDWFKEAIVKW